MTALRGALVLVLVAACAPPPTTPPGLCDPQGADNAGAVTWRPTVNTVITRLSDSKHLNRALPFPIWVIANATHLDGNPNTLAYACPINGPGGNGARIAAARELHIEPEMVGKAANDMNAVLAHETFHCFQDALGTRAEIDQAGKLVWVREGTAAWAGEVIAEEELGGASNLIDGQWKLYVQHPETSLFDRVYDAIGFYAELRRAGQNPWQIFDAHLVAARKDSVAAYSAAAGSTSSAFVDSWAASYLRRSPPDFSPAWNMAGPGLKDTVVYSPPVTAVGNTDATTFKADLFKNDIERLDVTADVVLISAMGPVRLHDSAAYDVLHLGAIFGDQRLCTKPGGCKCPDGLELLEATPPLYLALTGAAIGASAAVRGISLDEFCKDRPDPPRAPDLPPGACASANCARHTADPHLLTFDQRAYDFQAAGEFLVTTSPGRDFEIQARQQPLGSWPVSVDTAYAMNVGGDRIGFYLRVDGLEVHVNGSTVTLADGSGTLLPAGGTLFSRAGRYSVSWPDGTQAFVRPIHAIGLSLELAPAAARAGTLKGMLGDFDGRIDDDFVTRDGVAMPAPLSFDDLYHVYGESWRLQPGESLFDYGPGESTETFTDRSFPARATEAADLPADVQAAARATCINAGVTDARLLEECIIDVGLSGDAAFAEDARATQEHFTMPPPGSTTPTTLDGPPVTLTVATDGGDAAATFTVAAGTKVFVDVQAPGLADQCGVVTLLAPGNGLVGAACVIAGNGFIDGTVLMVAGTYTLRFTPTHAGSVTLRVTSAVDQSGTTSIDGSPVTAVVASRGAVSRWTFSATAGQKIFIDAPSSTLGDQLPLALFDPSASRIGGGCVFSGNGFIDGIVLPVSGQYTVVVDPSERNVGTTTLKVIGVTDEAGTIVSGGPTVEAVVSQYGGASRFTFSGTAGARVFIDVPASTLPDQCGAVTLRDPSGAWVASGCVISGNGFVDAAALPVSGTYTIEVNPTARDTGHVTLKLYPVQDQTGTLTLNGPSATAGIDGFGKRALFTFTAAANDRLKVAVTGSTFADTCGLVTVVDPAGSTASSGCVIGGIGTIGPVTLATAGTYTVLVDPVARALGSVTVALRPGP